LVKWTKFQRTVIWLVCVCVVSLVGAELAFSATGPAQKPRQDLIRYTDDNGRLVIVDAMAKVPPAYRERVERIRMTGDEHRLLNRLAALTPKERRSPDLVPRLFLKFTYADPWVIGWFAGVLVMLFLPFSVRHPLNRISVLMACLIVLVVVHVFIVSPRQARRARAFHQTWLASQSTMPDLPSRPRLDAVIRHRFLDAFPLNPVAFQWRVLSMAAVYRRALTQP